MPWNGDPEHFPPDAVRSYIGDRDPANPLLTDQEYAKFLTDSDGNVRRAAHAAALALAGQYARKVDITDGDIRRANSQMAKGYNDLASSLLASTSGDAAGVQLVAPLAGGITDPVTGLDVPSFFDRTSPF